jgi:hypothetical protein
VTSEDGFASGSDAMAEAILATGSTRLRQSLSPTDHGYVDYRAALQSAVLLWLITIAPDVNGLF